jgi:hypothetical protein
MERSFKYKRELVLSLLILVWVVVSGIWSLPPLVYVSHLGETIKESWVDSPELEPPFGHAELVSLQTFCKKQRIPLDQAMMALRAAGFIIESPKSTLAEIAETKSSSGMGVYQVIKKLEIKPEAMKPGAEWTAEKVEEVFSGTGLGNKTLGQIIKELSLDRDTIYTRLKTYNMDVNEDDKFKQLAQKGDTTPIKILITMLVDDPEK